MRRIILIAACLGVVLVGGAAAIILMNSTPAHPAPDDTTVSYTSEVFTSEIRSYDDHITFSLVPEPEEGSFFLSWELKENGTTIRSADREEVAGPLTMDLVADRNPEAEYTFRFTILSPDGTILSSLTSVIHRGETGTEVSRNVLQDKQM
ncbi:MAG: hypothetical protein GKC05_05650 [Methanomicrobiales archaeon]|nr:hypothetical protein [Methanomicrobiales archaeon]NYT21049.1 hypothetical protein [Methanomicrobiales archaeon]